jgi:D-threo-aldose 1-dehydrogenase
VRGGGIARFNYAAAAPEWIERTAAIEAVCEAFDVPLRAAALQFPLAHPAIDIVMVGAHSAAQWRDSVAMMERIIPAPFWHALRERGLVPPQVPLPLPS